MRLAAASDVLNVLGTQSSTGTTGAAGVALDATFPLLEERLETSLVLSVRKDTFDIEIDEESWPRLRLACSFVALDEAFTVTLSTGEVLASSAYNLDHRRGLLSILSDVPAGRGSVVVQYTAGFANKPGDTLTLTGVPESLKQAHIAMACSFMQMNPASVPKDKARAIKMDPVKAYEGVAFRAMSAYTRPRALCIWPSREEILE